MEQTNTNMDAAAMASKRPQFLTVLCILSFIGSGLWALLSIIGMAASGWILGMMGIAVSSSVSADNMSSADVATTEAASGLLGMGTTFFIIIFLISLIFAGLSLFGVVKMWQQKKAGFIIYTIVNGIVLAAYIYSGSWLMAAVSAAFIGMYAANLKSMA